MEININTPQPVRFDQVKVTDVMIIPEEDGFWFRTIKTEVGNVVNLVTGEVAIIPPDQPVVIINCKLVGTL